MKSQRYEMIDKFVFLFSIQALKYQRRNHQSISQAAKTMTGRWFAICLTALCLLLVCSVPNSSAQTTIPGMTITQDTTFGPNAVNAPADTIYIIEGDITVYHPQVNSGTVT